MWRDVTEHFSEKERYYKEMYLEIDEVYGEELEVSLFSSETEPYEIYISYDIMYGIIYVDAEHADAKREEVKIELANDYQKNQKPSDEFMKQFSDKHKLCIPNDVFFDASGLFDF